MAAEPTVPDEAPDARQQSAVTTDYRYAPIPEGVLYSDLSDKAVRIYGTLMRHGMTPASCYPSHARIASLIGCEKRSVQRPLRELEQAGWITRVPRHDDRGDRTSDGFVVHVSARGSAPTAHDSAEGSARERAVHRADARAEREPVNESQPERENPPAPTASQTTLELVHPSPPEPHASLSEMVEFDRFWIAYPRKTAKAEALTAWRQMIRKGHRVVDIVRGAERYAADPNLPEVQFVPHPATWLRGQRWNDPPCPPRSASARVRPAGDADAARAAVASLPAWASQFLDDAPPPRPIIDTRAL